MGETKTFTIPRRYLRRKYQIEIDVLLNAWIV